jgi:inhibitor of KinA
MGLFSFSRSIHRTQNNPELARNSCLIMITIHPLGDAAALVYLQTEDEALAFAAAVRSLSPGWLVDLVQAHTSVAVYFDLEKTDFHSVRDFLSRLEDHSVHVVATSQTRTTHIPCCYELALDMERVANATGLPAAEVIRLHTAAEYTVYAIGFCPGFPYLGYLPQGLCGVPRLPSPRLQVPAGSVGLTGRQTGIYPEVRPGGWNIIGRTPLELVNVAEGYFPLRTGDRVRFEPIAEARFHELLGQRLPERVNSG